MFLGKNWKFFISYRGYRDCFVTKCFSQKPQSFSRLISRLFNLRKTHVFNFFVADVTVFQNFLTSLALPLSNPSQPKITFHLNPIIFKQKSLQNHFKVCFPKHCFHFCLKFCRFQLRVLKIGDFQKLGWGSYFCEIFFKILIGLSPICCVCIYVGPIRHFKHVLRQISSCSCIFHRCCVLLHVRCLTECPNDILVLNWTQVSPFAWVYS